MTSPIRNITDEKHFQLELAAASSKLVIADFTATWCAPCQIIAPVYQRLAAKYVNAIFLKIDVDKCQEIAATQGVSAMPTFIFYRNKAKLDKVLGADAISLESKIVQHLETPEQQSSSGATAAPERAPPSSPEPLP